VRPRLKRWPGKMQAGLLSRESENDPGAEELTFLRKQYRTDRQGEIRTGQARSLEPEHAWTHLTREPGDPDVRPVPTMVGLDRGEKSKDTLRRCTDAGSLTVAMYRRSLRTKERVLRRNERWRSLNGHAAGNGGHGQEGA
jgi:hypothetical protein